MENNPKNPYDNSNDNYSNPFENDFNVNNNNNKENLNSSNPFENEKQEENNINALDKNEDDDFSNPFKNEFIGNNNNNNFNITFKGNSNNLNNEKNNNNEFGNPFEQEFDGNEISFKGNSNNLDNEKTNNNELGNPFEQEFKKNDINNKDNNNLNNEKFNNDELSNPFKQEFQNNPYNQNNNDDFSNPFKNVVFNNNINENNINNNNNNFNPYSNKNNNNDDNPFEKNVSGNPILNEINLNYQSNKFKNNYNNNNINNDFNNNNNKNFNHNYNNNNNFNNYNNYNNNFNNNNNYNNYSKNMNNFNNQKNNFSNNNKAQNNIFENQPKVNIKNDYENEDLSNENDIKKIKAIIDKCEYLYNVSITQYESIEIREALATLCKAIKGLDSLKNTINTQKQYCLPLLPTIKALRDKSFSKLQEFRIMVYKLIPIKFRPVLYRPYEDQNETLINFCSRYILTKPFISFDDIFDNNVISYTLNKNISEANVNGNKCFLIYGPKGCGKTLYVHALANHLGAKIAQIEGIELFKIPFFAREFMKACFASMQFKPLIIYIKNIEQMFSTLNNLNYIYDKVASSYHLNVYFFASSSINVYNLPKQIPDKFQYFQCIKPIVKNLKADYIRFIGVKIGIEIKMDQQSLNNFALDNLHYYSNEDIFDLIRIAIDIKKQNSPPNDENWVYREGLYKEDLMKAFYHFKGSLTDEVLKSYHL